MNKPNKTERKQHSLLPREKITMVPLKTDPLAGAEDLCTTHVHAEEATLQDT